METGRVHYIAQISLSSGNAATAADNGEEAALPRGADAQNHIASAGGLMYIRLLPVWAAGGAQIPPSYPMPFRGIAV